MSIFNRRGFLGSLFGWAFAAVLPKQTAAALDMSEICWTASGGDMVGQHCVIYSEDRAQVIGR